MASETADSRRAPALMFACAHPAIEPAHPRAADPADRAGLRRRHHRVGLPGRARHHGPAAGARQEQDQAGRHSVPGARARRSARAARRGAGRDLRRLLPKAGPIPPAPRPAAAISPRKAIWLGRLVASLLPDEPEALGLLALMLHAEARRGARRNARGDYVPLAEQDPHSWSTRADRRGRGAAVPGEPHGRDRPLSARGGGAVGPRGAPAHRAGPTGPRSSGSTTRCSR